jgi:predicted thioredoxin/glutaredoxin
MNTDGNKRILRIYVGKHCWSCEESVRLAEHLRREFAQLNVEVIDLEAEGSVNHDGVFSTPTYVFDGQTISLGNPTAEELFAKLSASLTC